MPPKRASKDWEILQENNLIYVAFTRAKHVLGFVSEDEIKPSGSLDNDETIVNDIAFIEKQVCRVLCIPFTEDKQSPSFAKFRLKAATKIENKHKNDNMLYVETIENEEEMSLDELLESL
jgi:ATP-dependent exoDNAse (exonuclease V) beta subunit